MSATTTQNSIVFDDKQKGKLWKIHGEYYDMSPFVKRHPAGETFILLGKGRDCTELFESVHCLSKVDFTKIFDKYRVKDSPVEDDLFEWSENGFYKTLVGRVRKHFDEKHGGFYKAPLFYWFKLALQIGVWITLLSLSISYSSILLAILAGFTIESIGFTLMHDSSHGSVTKSGAINILLMSIWTNLMLWSPFLWLNHHIYAHHSYTAIYPLDPDISHAKVLIRKHEKTSYRPAHAYQKYLATFLLTLFPNQHLGQTYFYMLTMTSSAKIPRLFGLPIKTFPSFWRYSSYAVFTLSILFHFILPYFLVSSSTSNWTVLGMIFFYWSAAGTAYFLNVAPNHDTIETHENMKNCKGRKVDWGEEQVRGSLNHTTDGSLWSRIICEVWGGMNFQIEHHLFPAVSHEYYAELSPIVRATCKEFGIEYQGDLSWWGALGGWGKLIEKMGHEVQEMTE
eukprot:TRINITY_DN2340_c0_g1_i1.p1 TRINITY_DN2340_c0_g1~~TRINITY_DN2340_c0_g1_i1.p1  ORF type:complete len:452 (-),score=59.01 TRINITY_DN2340_c0_g1_i1:17-1372(-)